MINELRLKTERCVTCFLFFFSTKSTLKESSLSDGNFTIHKCWLQDNNFGFYMVYTAVLNASYEIKSCLLLNNFMFSCCFHVFLNSFFVPRVDVNRRGEGAGGSKFLTSNGP